MLESIGITEIANTTENEVMLKNFNNSILYKNNQYYIELPWKIPHPNILDNFYVAKAHLGKLHKKLESAGNLYAYDNVIKEHLSKNFIEEVPFNISSSNVHYLTHRGVFREDSLTTKLRIVFNCSLKDKNKISLNDCLVQGPNMINDLVKVLLNFRLGKYAIVSDISKAFLRIQLKLEYDRNHLRFLWYKEPSDPSKGLVIYRYKVVPFGANCSPCILALTIKYHLETFPNSPVIDFLKNSFYIDNLVGSVDAEKELISIYTQANKIMQQGNFSLAEYVSNSKFLNSLIHRDQLGYSGVSPIKLLGMNWHLDENSLNHDTISTKAYDLDSGAKTKRKILSETSKIFDPLGLFTPSTIRSRIFLQTLWKSEVGWDETLAGDEIKYWQSLAKDLNKIQTIKLERCIGSKSNNNSLHLFVDSSTKAYGCVAYLVGSEPNLLFSKGKVVPLKGKRTIPQLELLAICLGVKIITYLMNLLHNVLISNIFLWTDSQICLNWLQQGSAIKTKNIFVKNRLVEINAVNHTINYRYIATNCNPADFITRGISHKLLKNNNAWFKGPKILEDPNKWTLTPLTCNLGKIEITPNLPDPLLNLNNYSSFNKLLRITGFCFKFIYRCRKENYSSLVPLNYWIIHCQKVHFSKEYNFLKSNANWKPDSHLPLISQFNLFIDPKGIIRCKGRIQKAKIYYSSKNPILLPRDSHFTLLLIRNIHVKLFHMGANQTLAEVRKEFWIPKGKATVKTILKDCVTCKRIHAHAFKTPNPPQLPVERVTLDSPFSSTGIDYTSSVTVTFNKSNIKVYIVLFTCSASRAISLDLVEDLTAESFLAAFRRFCARYNTPKTVWTDNALYFQKGEKLINKILAQSPVLSHLEQNHIKWKYSPVQSPWHGSIYERCIKTVKDCLKKSIGFRQLNFFELLTLLAEIENIVNNRPLTYVDSELNSLEPLTPNHLLKGRLNTGLPEDIDPEDIDFIDRDMLLEKLKNRLKAKKHFTERWTNEYLLSLRQFHNDNVGFWDNLIKVGDIVLIHNTTPRLSWALGRVIELLTGEDGVSRVARLKTATGVTTRDITLLYPLETSLRQPPNVTIQNDNLNNASPQASVNCPINENTRPKRAAAKRAGTFLRQKIGEGTI